MNDEHQPPGEQGGLVADCGCRVVRTGGEWVHTTPCGEHALSRQPLSDKGMKTIFTED